MDNRERGSRRRFLSSLTGFGAVTLTSGWVRTLLSGDTSNFDGEKKPRWRVGCYTRPWADHEYRVALDAIAKAGFRYVGLMTTKSPSRLVISPQTPVEEARKIGEEARRRGLEIDSVYGGGIPVRKSLEAGISALRRLVDNCAAAKARSLLMGGNSDPKTQDNYYKAIRECCEEAAKKRVAIVLKPHGGLNATGPQCRKVLEFVGHENFRLWYDPGNIFYYSDGKLDPVDDAVSVNGLVTGMCVKDYRHPKNVLVTPGEGQVNFPRVFEILLTGGLSEGSLLIETLEAGDLKHLAGEARKARAFVEGVVSALSVNARRK